MKKYLNFDKKSGYLIDKNIFYECINCTDVTPSMHLFLESPITFKCFCENIIIDEGRLTIKNHENIKIFKKL
jgi:hypothetical protein